VHAFAGTTTTFFRPALAAGLWLPTVKELLSQTTHVITVLYIPKVGLAEFKLFARIVYDFIIGKATRTYSTNG
jgi:hypothetical protein